MFVMKYRSTSCPCMDMMVMMVRRFDCQIHLWVPTILLLWVPSFTTLFFLFDIWLHQYYLLFFIFLLCWPSNRCFFVFPFVVVPFMGGFFPDGIPRTIILRDPVGTRIEVGLNYSDGYLCIYDGQNTLGTYYNIKLRGRLQLTYDSPLSLLMKVRDRDFVEIDYPKPVVHFTLSRLKEPVPLIGNYSLRSDFKSHPRSCFHFALCKTLTCEDLQKLVSHLMVRLFPSVLVFFLMLCPFCM